MKKTIVLLACLVTITKVMALPTEVWRGILKRADGNNVVFNFEKVTRQNKTVLFIMNGAERLRVDSVHFSRDSVFIEMPFFESKFKAAVKKGKWTGVWIKGTSKGEQVMPFIAERSATRFVAGSVPSRININGRWAIRFQEDSSMTSVAEFWQRGNRVTGSILTPSGDYRFLEGQVSGNKLMLSAFDGSHAVLFTADILNKKAIAGGVFYSGATYKESWEAERNAKATVKADLSAMYVKPGEDRLNFTFEDMNRNKVSINDDRFKNKVVIIQLMGSWCPNCMDETAFLSDYYQKNKDRGVEVVGLAYEYSTDFDRSMKGLKKFKERFNVTYPLLLTGVAITDTLRTEKTLPQVTPIKTFPSTIILDKTGKISKLETGFFGPGTGEHHQVFVKEFTGYIDKLLAEGTD